MIRELESVEDGSDGRADCRLFGTVIDVLVNGDGVTMEYAQACAVALDGWSDDLVDALCAASDRYRLASRSPGRLGSGSRAVLELVKPSCLQFWPPDGPGIAYSLELNVAWEPEDGMEWYIKDDQVVYVGPAIGSSPWDDPAEFDPNYA